MLITLGWIFPCIIFSKMLWKADCMHKVCWTLSQGQAHVQQGTGDHSQLTSLTLLWPLPALWAMFEVVTSKPRGTPGIHQVWINAPLLSDLWVLLWGGLGSSMSPELLRLLASPRGSCLACSPAGFKLLGCRRHQVFVVTNSMQNKHL